MAKQGFGHTGKRDLPEGELKWQVRINLSEEFAAVARENPASPALAPVLEIIRKYDGHLKHQEMSFGNFLPYFENEEEPVLKENFEAALEAMQQAREGSDIAAQVETFTAFEKAAAELIERTRLYLWTKDTMNKPSTQEKYAKRFTIYADGGQEVYSKETADALVAELETLKEQGIVEKIDKFDSDPAHNPQPPAKFHM